jgi:hypothetical protein
MMMGTLTNLVNCKCVQIAVAFLSKIFKNNLNMVILLINVKSLV